MGWINCAFCVFVNYYQLVTLIEDKQKVLNACGLVTVLFIFLFMVLNFGQPSLLCLKHLVRYVRRALHNQNNRGRVEVMRRQRNFRE
jgi:hypothetical protein